MNVGERVARHKLLAMRFTEGFESKPIQECGQGGMEHEEWVERRRGATAREIIDQRFREATSGDAA